VDGIQARLLKEHYSHLLPQDHLRRGFSYRCQKCEALWHLPPGGDFLNRVYPEDLDTFHAWNARSLVASECVEEAFATLGAVQGYGPKWSVPCRATNQEGTVHENALVIGWDHPPGRWYRENGCKTGWVHEIVSAEPSPNALPLEVRQATESKAEEAMAFAPVGVVDASGKRFTLPRASHFFCDGPGIRIAERKRGWFGGQKIHSPMLPDIYFFADFSR